MTNTWCLPKLLQVLMLQQTKRRSATTRLSSLSLIQRRPSGRSGPCRINTSGELQPPPSTPQPVSTAELNRILIFFQLLLFSLQAGGGLQAGETRRANAALLDLNWLEDGAVTFKADNGKFVGTKKSGHLFANVDTVDERSKYGNGASYDDDETL